MKSSSELYPVTLLKAECIGQLSEDVYLIKHNLDTDKSVEIAVSHLANPNQPATRGPVVLVHGSFSNRGFWISNKGEGLAKHLVEQGFDVWLMEHRGHGNSPRNHDYSNNTLERYVLHDLKAVNDFVQEKSAQKPIWLGHSMGGIMIASAVAAGVLHAENCQAFITMGSQVIERPNSIRFPLAGQLLVLRSKRMGEIDGPKYQLGPENEPAGVIVEFVKRHSLFGGWAFISTKQRLMPAWRKANPLPMLAIAAVADSTDSAASCEKFAKLYGGTKEVWLLGKEQGYARDYGHVDMVVSKDAAKEVWPRISAWLVGF